MGLFNDDFVRDQLQALPSFGEITRSFLALDPSIWMMIIGAVLWLILLRMPLRAIDRRDRLTGYTYMIFLIASGVILTIALPSRLSKSTDLTTGQLATIGIMSFAAFLRWTIRPRLDQKAVVVTAKKEEKAS